jgi:hypothetical protein
MAKQAHFTVTLETPNTFDSGYTIAHSRSFRSENSAMRHAEKLRDRHCSATRYTLRARRAEVYVCSAKRPREHTRLDPVIVPSVGELGYW